MFDVGKTYKTKEGKDVKIIAAKWINTNYHCVEGDVSCPVYPLEAQSCVEWRGKTKGWNGAGNPNGDG